MSVWRANVVLEDDYGRKTRKVAETVDISGADLGAELLAAQTIVTDWLTDLGNMTEARILSYELSYRVVYTDTVTTGANIDEGLTMVVRKEDNYNAIIKVPAPVNSIFNGDGTLDLTDAAVTAYMANFIGGTGLTVSDGEVVTELISGKLDK